MTRYMHELPQWPAFQWDHKRLIDALAAVRYKQGRLIGKMESLGLSLREQAVLRTLTMDVLKSSEIEGQFLDPDRVRSSIADRLGIGEKLWLPPDHRVDGVVDMMLDATQQFSHPLTAERLHGWHALLFSSSFSGGHRIRVGGWRDDAKGPMQVVSGEVAPERRTVYFEAPAADRVPEEMAAFLGWFDDSLNALERDGMDSVLRAGVAHLWFVTIHPFDDGNGRIARAIMDMALAQSENSALRFYSMSAQFRRERKAYYAMLQATQKRADLDVTAWLEWFIASLDRALAHVDAELDLVLRKSHFWDKHRDTALNPRQTNMLNRLLDGTVEHITSSKWAKIIGGGLSHDTALHDIAALIALGILIKDPEEGGRSTRYLLVPSGTMAGPQGPPTRPE
jgi:Fic family protein